MLRKTMIAKTQDTVRVLARKIYGLTSYSPHTGLTACFHVGAVILLSPRYLPSNKMEAQQLARHYRNLERKP